MENRQKLSYLGNETTEQVHMTYGIFIAREKQLSVQNKLYNSSVQVNT